MCLQKTDLNLSWNAKEECFVGYGYKAMDVTDKNGRINKSVMKNFLKNVIVLPDGWYEACGHWGNVEGCDKIVKNDNVIWTNRGQPYWPGFHIFLNQEDAETYNKYTDVVKVMYNDLIAIGVNANGNNGYGKTVIASYMKIVEVVRNTHK